MKYRVLVRWINGNTGYIKVRAATLRAAAARASASAGVLMVERVVIGP